MSNMLYILGVDHSFQSYHGENFSDYIPSKVKDFDIKLIGEEYSTDSCKMFHPHEESQLKQIALELEIEHIYCDPTEEERKLLGIEDGREIVKRLNLSYKAYSEGTDEWILVQREKRKQWIHREKEWLKRLISKDFEKVNTLFVLGDSHTKRFKRLVERKGIPITIFDVEEFKHELSKR